MTEAGAYRSLYASLRADIVKGVYGPDDKLPTEYELIDTVGVGRQTVRRAYQMLSDDGLVYRVKGRGTFIHPPSRWPLRSLGSAEWLFGAESTIDIVETLAPATSSRAAAELGVAEDAELYSISLRRFQNGLPFVFAHSFFPPDVGALLLDEGDIRRRFQGTRSTMLGLVAKVWPQGLLGVRQATIPVAVSEDIAAHIECTPGEPVLALERLYYDREWKPIQFTIDTLNPRRFRYEFSCATSPSPVLARS